MGFALVPEYNRSDIILQGQVAAIAPPAQGLDGYFQVFFKTYGIGYMPAVESEALHHIIMPIATDHLVQTRIRGTEFCIIDLVYPCRILCTGIKIIGAAEIVFRACTADRREILVAINEEFDLAFAPPAIIVYTPGDISAHIMSLSLDTFHEGIIGFIRERIDAAELGMEISCVIGYLGKGIIHLVIQDHVFRIDIFHGDPAFFPEGHGPIAVKGAAWVYINGEGGEFGIASPAHTEEIADRAFHGGFFLIIPVKAQDGITPVASGGHPDMLNGPGAFNFSDRERGFGFDAHAGTDFPALTQVAGWAGTGAGGGHATFTLFSIEIFGADGAGPGIREPVQVTHIHINAVEFLLGQRRDPGQYTEYTKQSFHDGCLKMRKKGKLRKSVMYSMAIHELCRLKSMKMGILQQEFDAYRSRMNEVILSKNNLVMKRLWNLDTNTYEDGALDKKTKEMLGLVASMVLRCDDCIKYHVGKCHELGLTTEELYEVFAVANIVGGTIVIPHTRRAAEYWEELIGGK